MCAALAAARLGMPVVLAGNRPVLGGNSSSEIRVWMRGATGAGNLFSEEMGVLGQLKMRNQYINGDGNPVFWDDVQLDEVLAEPNITLLLNTELCSLTMEQDRIKSVRGVQLGSEIHWDIAADWYIDCTGDGTLGYYAGVPYSVGQAHFSGESNDDAGEAVNGLLGNTIFYYVRHTDHPVPFVPPRYAYSMEVVEGLINRGGRVVNEKQSGSDYWWFEYGGLGDTIEEHQSTGMELRRLVMGVWNYIKNSGKFDAGHLTLEWVGSFPGKRESRRLDGAHILTRRELLAGANREDGAFYGGWYMDDHPSEGFQTQEDSCVQVPVNIYEIPFSCLYHPTVKNLFFAGRDIGVSREVFFSSRVMNTCALSGQAAATLACVCNRLGADTSQMPTQAVRQAKQLLQREDMLLFTWMEDSHELGREAETAVSSVWSGVCPADGAGLPADQQIFLTVPGRLSTARLWLSAAEDTTLNGTWYLSPLPSRYCPGQPVGQLSLPVRKGESCVSLPVPQVEQGFCTLMLEPAPGVVLATSKLKLPGVLMGYPTDPHYHTPVLRLEGLYTGEHLTEPYNRPWNGPNAWVPADNKEQWATLTWKQSRPIREVRVYFDPDLSMELPSTRTQHIAPSHLFAGREGMPPQLVRDFTLWLRQEGQWVKYWDIQDNWKRMAVLVLPENTRTDSLKLELKRTWGGSPGAVYGIRVYDTVLANSI